MPGLVMQSGGRGAAAIGHEPPPLLMPGPVETQRCQFSWATYFIYVDRTDHPALELHRAVPHLRTMLLRRLLIIM